MKKFSIFIVLLFVNSVFLFSQENALIKSLRDKMISNINSINSLRLKFLDPVMDATDDIINMKKDGLEKVYLYNEKKIMYREINTGEDISLNISLVHINYINLSAVSQQKIYISELYVIKGKTYYFIGCKNDKKSVLFLFSLSSGEDLPENFSLINSKGEIFFSKNINNIKHQSYIKKINDPKTDSNYFSQNKITKFKFFPNHEIYYFIEF